MGNNMVDFRGHRPSENGDYLPDDSDLILFIIEQHIPPAKRTERMKYLLTNRYDIGSKDLLEEDYIEVEQKTGISRANFMSEWRKVNIDERKLVQPRSKADIYANNDSQ
ncbi:MAG: hypothetical protein EXS55_04640 [Candidatus Magasanikbacteria bacterium]|nr:hypothetical protein [Candidatus Magasanikbacteria bacterium]